MIREENIPSHFVFLLKQENFSLIDFITGHKKDLDLGLNSAKVWIKKLKKNIKIVVKNRVWISICFIRYRPNPKMDIKLANFENEKQKTQS